MKSRRSFLAGFAALAAAPLAAQEKAARIYRIGVLETLAEPSNADNMKALRKELADEGYVEGKNLRIDYLSAEGQVDRFPRLAAELARRKVDLFVVNGTPAALAARGVAPSIPVVAASALDPVDTGLVASLERPGGNVTGMAILTSEVEKKRVELLWALAPGRKRLAVLVNMANPALASAWPAIEAAARTYKMQAQLLEVKRPGEAKGALEAALQKKADALVVRVGALPEAERRQLVELAARHRLPAIYGQRQAVEEGGLVSYGLNVPYLFGRAAGFAHKILKGAKPGELAMEQPTKFELVINRKAVKALELVVPPDLLLRSELVG